jgi:hypothetical protein
LAEIARQAAGTGFPAGLTPGVIRSARPRSGRIDSEATQRSGLASCFVTPSPEAHGEPPNSPKWTRACSFSNSHGTRKICSQSRSRARSAGYSISCYRTAPGRMVKWSPPSANRLIYWRKLTSPRRGLGRARWRVRPKPRFGSPSWKHLGTFASRRQATFARLSSRLERRTVCPSIVHVGWRAGHASHVV